MTLTPIKNTPLKTVLVCGLILLAGIASSVGVYVALDNVNTSRKNKALSDVYNTFYNNLQWEIERNLNALYAIKANYIAHKGFNRSEFAKYANYYTTNIKSIQALEWVPRIVHDERDSFEVSVQRERFPEFQITTKADDNIIRAEDRPVYFPVCFIEPFVGNETALGIDPGESLPQRQSTIHHAMQTGGAAASQVANLVQKRESDRAVFVFVPIYKDDLGESTDETEGLIEGVYLVESLISTAIDRSNLAGKIEVAIAESDNANQLIFGKEILDSSIDLGNVQSGTIALANRTWDIHVTYLGSTQLLAVTPAWAFIMGLVFTLLLTKTVFDTLTDNRKELQRHVKELENKNRDLEQYAYVASHDLQEPLHTLQGLVNLVDEEYHGKFDAMGKQYLQFIKEASNRMGSLISNLLKHSRIGQMEELKVVNCNNLIEDVKHDLSKTIEDDRVKIIIKNELPTLKGYPSALHQLFQNLISNAIKFRQEGVAPIVEISAQHKDAGWEFAIQDNGIGIPESQREQIFVIFKRLHNRSKYDGTGIGLANCKKIVELHDGRIWVEAGDNGGSIFYFTLNLV